MNHTGGLYGAEEGGQGNKWKRTEGEKALGTCFYGQGVGIGSTGRGGLMDRAIGKHQGYRTQGIGG